MRSMHSRSARRPPRAGRTHRSVTALLPLWLMAGVMAAFSCFSVAVMSFLLAYVMGESQWSKGQKDAVHALERYVRIRDETDYREFLGRIAVPLADRTARLEMDKAAPDHAATVAALLEGRIAREDTDGMIWLYRSFGNTPLFSRAVAFWAAGDQYILQLREVGNRLHDLVRAGKADDRAIEALLAQVREIDIRLAPIESGFSLAIDDAAHGTKDALILASTLSAALLLLIFTRHIRRSFSRSERLEAELRANEERLSLGFEGINAGLWDWDMGSNRIYHSQWLTEQLGYGAGDRSVDATLFETTLHPDDLPRVRHALVEHLSRSVEYDVEFRLKAAEGGYVWCRSHGKAVRDAEGKAVRMVGCLFDVSDRKKAEASAHSERELAQLTLASIGDAVFRIDEASRVIYCNQMAGRMLGRAAADMYMKAFDSVCELRHEATGERIASGSKRLTQPGASAGNDVTRDLYLVRSDGTGLAVDYSVTVMHNEEGVATGAVVVLYDVSAERKHAAELAYQATHDELTDLVNRREFERRLGELLDPGTGDAAEHAVMYLDLDQFKVVNDTCGHTAGDELIRHVSTTLQGCLRHTDTLARLGGDEFGVVLPHCTVTAAVSIAEMLRQAVEGIRLPWSERILTSGVSVGVVGAIAKLASVKEVMKAADVACYMAKEKGRNRVHLFSIDDQELSARRTQMEWVSRVKAALDQNRFCLFAQKIAPLKPGLASGGMHLEVLLRMREESGAIVGPAAFLPAAERFNLMPLVDRWVISSAFAELATRAAHGSTWSINLSGASLGDEQLFDFIVEQGQQHGIPFEQVCFEITETAAISNLQDAMALIGRLRKLGCRFALDDFGAGMSSFTYLKHLDVDYLKIDGSFIKGIVDSPLDRAIVHSINEIAHATGKQTIAEFAESESIIDRLRDMGIDYAQGYGIGLPEPLVQQQNNVEVDGDGFSSGARAGLTEIE